MRKSSLTIYIVFMLVLFVALTAAYYVNYRTTVGIIRSEHKSKIDLVELGLYNEIAYTEAVNQIVEKEIHATMERHSKALVELYGRNPAVMEWDLYALKAEFDDMDIYIIDKELKVIASTLLDEIGLDFNAYPRYASLLKQRIAGDAFEADAINFSFHDGELKTYSYIPTPDHEYLLELSVNIRELHPEVELLNISNLMGDMRRRYPFIEEINIFRFEGVSNTIVEVNQKRDDPSPFAGVFQDQLECIRYVSETGEVRERTFVLDGNQYTLHYVPFEHVADGPRLTWWRPYVLEILFNDQSMVDVINDQKRVYVYSFVITTVLYFSLILGLYYGVSAMRTMAYTDYLTRLPNRKKFEEELQSKLKEMSRKGTLLAVFFFDLNGFKALNDKYGHSFGDRLLQRIARRVVAKKGKNWFAARLGGDEFVGFVHDLHSMDDVEKAAKHLHQMFDQPFTIDSHKIPVSVSIGFSVSEGSDNSVEKLVFEADQAMYKAKREGFGYVIYSARRGEVAFTLETKNPNDI